MSRTRTTAPTFLRSNVGDDVSITLINPHLFDVWIGNYGFKVPAESSVLRQYSSEFAGYGSIYNGTSGTITDENLLPAVGFSYNPVYHQKEEATCPLRDISATVQISCHRDDGSPSPNISGVIAGMVASGDFAVPTAPALTSGEILIARATQSMRPGVIPGAVDLPRFVAELKDFADIYKGAASNLLAIKRKEASLASILKDADRRLTRYANKVVGSRGVPTAMSTLIGSLINADLTYKFAIAPFLKDVGGIVKACQSIESTMADLAAPKPFRVYGKASDEDTTDHGDTQLQLFKKGLKSHVKREVVTWAICQRNPLLLTEWEVLKRLLKLDVRARTLWELAPLSFVVDWFVRVGDFIGQFEPDALSVPYSVIASGASQKDTYTVVGQKTMFSGVSWVVPTGLKVVDGMVKRTIYQRSPMELPWTSSAINPIKTSLPSFDKVGTLVEILTAHALRR